MIRQPCSGLMKLTWNNKMMEKVWTESLRLSYSSVLPFSDDLGRLFYSSGLPFTFIQLFIQVTDIHGMAMLCQKLFCSVGIEQYSRCSHGICSHQCSISENRLTLLGLLFLGYVDFWIIAYIQGVCYNSVWIFLFGLCHVKYFIFISVVSYILPISFLRINFVFYKFLCLISYYNTLFAVKNLKNTWSIKITYNSMTSQEPLLHMCLSYLLSVVY